MQKKLKVYVHTGELEEQVQAYGILLDASMLIKLKLELKYTVLIQVYRPTYSNKDNKVGKVYEQLEVLMKMKTDDQ